ncbi:MAG: lysophospholipid acyltransferase family protein [Rickettsiales bacterium]|jgi:KDO2-lipid IV(A) lauroyltransferase|nr:lysophospholipid acyltransferase family protein [Rickettsiales bacterium]
MDNSNDDRSFLKKILDVFGLLGFKITFVMAKVLPMSVASAIFANIFVLLSPFIPKTYLIIKNLGNVMPGMPYFRRIQLMFKIWHSLGRFAGEYPYVYNFEKNEIFKYVNFDSSVKNTLDRLKHAKTGSIIFSAHLSNWEIGLRALADYGIKIGVIFRKLNNPLLEPKYSKSLREKIGINMIAKHDGAAINIIKSLRSGRNIIIMADQKDEARGILVDFFGKKAYTSRSIYVLAKKLKVSVYGMRIIRDSKNPMKFSISTEEECTVTDEISEKSFLSKYINDVIERWIRENPEQWFWIHSRWKI